MEAGPAPAQNDDPDYRILQIGHKALKTGASMLLPLELHNVKGSFIVDTGSVVTIVSRTLYQKIPPGRRPPLKPPSEPMKLEVANEQLLDIDGVAKMKFVVGDKEFQWLMYIAPLAEDGLLGMDFLYAHDYVLGARTGLKLNGRKVPTQITDSPLCAKRVTMAADTVIPANTQLVVDGLCSANRYCKGLGVVEPLTELCEQKMLVGRSLVNADGVDLSIPVRLMNLSDTDRLIHKGTTIASLHDVHDIVPICDTEATYIPSPVNLTPTEGSHVPKEGRWPDSVKTLYKESSCQLTSPARTQLHDLIDKHIDLFAKSPTDLGHTTVVTHTIDTGNANPVKQAPRRPHVLLLEKRG